MQRGFVPIFIVIGVIISVVILLIPFPYYQSQDFLCSPAAPTLDSNYNCPKKGWYLGTPLWKQLINRTKYGGIQQENLQQVVISPSPTIITNEIANWKTYINQRFGYKIKYPRTWLVREVFEPISTDFESKDFRKDESGIVIEGSFAFVQTPQINLTLDQEEDLYKSKQDENQILLDIERVVISGHKALKINTESKRMKTRAITYTLDGDKYHYSISCNYLVNDDVNKKVCNILTATFELLK